MRIGIRPSASTTADVLDMTLLRRIGTRAFGVLLALGPAAGAGIGFLVLHEQLTVSQLGAMALVVLAGTWLLRQAATAVLQARHHETNGEAECGRKVVMAGCGASQRGPVGVAEGPQRSIAGTRFNPLRPGRPCRRRRRAHRSTG